MGKRRASKKTLDPAILNTLLGTLPPGVTPEMAMKALSQLMGGNGFFSGAGLPPREKKPKRTKKTPQERALTLVDKAVREEDSERCEQLLREALQEDPDCAEAYRELAELYGGTSEEVSYREQAVEAQARRLNAGGQQSAFERSPAVEKLLFLQVDLARTYERDQCYEEARETLEGVLEYDRNAPSYIKAELFAIYIDLDRDDLAGALIQRFPQEMGAEWDLGMALYLFRREGDSESTQETLRHVVTRYLPAVRQILGDNDDTSLFEDQFDDRFDDDASAPFEVAMIWRRKWKATPGAIAALRAVYTAVLEKLDQQQKPTWGELKSEVATLPQSDVEWVLDLLSTQPNQKPEQADWRAVILARDNHQLLACEPISHQPAADELLTLLAEIMLRDDGFNEVARPATIFVRDPALAKRLRGSLKGLKIACEVAKEWTMFDQVARGCLADEQLRSAKNSTPIAVEQLAALPQRPEARWQVFSRRLPQFVFEQGRFLRCWMTLVLALADGEPPYIQFQHVTPERPQGEALWKILTFAMQSARQEPAYRPGAIEVDDEAEQTLLAAPLAALDIDCAVFADVSDIDEVWATLQTVLSQRDGEEPNFAVSQAPGIKTEQLADFYAAAAEFYRQRPWRHVLGDRRINVACADLSCGSVDAIVMGQMGEVSGLALHEDRQELLRLLESAADFGTPADVDDAMPSAYRKQTGMSLLFYEEHEVAIADLDLIEAHGFPIAAPEAYPMIMHYERGALRSPLAWEVDLMTGILRAAPAFVHSDPDTVLSAQTPAGRALTMSWVDK